MRALLTLGLAVTLLFSCSKDEDSKPDSNNNNNPGANSEADAMTNAMIMPDGSEVISGPLPQAADAADAPSLNLDFDTIVGHSGYTSPIIGRYGKAKRRLGGASVYVEGASHHIRVPIPTKFDNPNGTFILPVALDGNTALGNRKVFISVYYIEDSTRYFSEPQEMMLDVVEGKGKDLQVTAVWDSQSDIALYLEDPSSQTISQYDINSNNGGRMEASSTAEGPEIISWKDTAPDGIYTIYVQRVTGSLLDENNCVISVSSGTNNLVYYYNQGTTTIKNTVGQFSKLGTDINFHF